MHYSIMTAMFYAVDMMYFKCSVARAWTYYQVYITEKAITKLLVQSVSCCGFSLHR